MDPSTKKPSTKKPSEFEKLSIPAKFCHFMARIHLNYRVPSWDTFIFSNPVFQAWVIRLQGNIEEREIMDRIARSVIECTIREHGSKKAYVNIEGFTACFMEAAEKYVDYVTLSGTKVKDTPFLPRLEAAMIAKFGPDLGDSMLEQPDYAWNYKYPRTPRIQGSPSWSSAPLPIGLPWALNQLNLFVKGLRKGLLKADNVKNIVISLERDPALADARLLFRDVLKLHLSESNPLTCGVEEGATLILQSCKGDDLETIIAVMIKKPKRIPPSAKAPVLSGGGAVVLLSDDEDEDEGVEFLCKETLDDRLARGAAAAIDVEDPGIFVEQMQEKAPKRKERATSEPEQEQSGALKSVKSEPGASL
jgi:hypothetical protein